MSFSGRFLELSVGRVYYERRGGGPGAPSLVLLHGYLVSHHYFRAVAGELQKHFDVIALDLPGYGESDRPSPDHFSYAIASLAEIVVEAMSALGVERAHIVGHSMGGGVATVLAARHPERVLRLVLEDAAVYPVPSSLVAQVALAPTVGPWIFEHVFGRRDLRRHLRSAHRNPEVATEEDVDFYWERFTRGGARRAAYASLRVLSSLDEHTADPGHVRAPTLVVWGEEDTLAPLALGRRLARQIQGSCLDVIPACGHSPHEERPREFLRAVIPFLVEDSAQRGGVEPVAAAER